MLDIKRIVEETDAVREALAKRMEPSEIKLDEVISLYKDWKSVQSEFEELRAKQNVQNEKIAKLDKKSADFKNGVTELKKLSDKIKESELKAKALNDQINSLLSGFPNVPDDDVVAGGKENNKVIREWGDEPKFDFEIKDHLVIGKAIGMLDFDRAAKLSGAQFPMYVGIGATLEWALVEYFKRTHESDGYTCVIPPLLVNEQSAYVAGQLPKFKDDLYWTQEQQCLVPTAETALVNFYRDEILPEKDLPKKFYSYTPCFRREAGTYGANYRGLMRVHQFNKVEMFQYATPEQSDKAFEEMVGKAEKLVQGLGLRYRVSKLAAEDMSFGMARTYDIEIWLPYDKNWIEVSSASNARDYQARRGNMRYKAQKDKKNYYVHTLNASGLATSRLMVALLETYQKEDGSVVVPGVLRDYVGKDVLPVV